MKRTKLILLVALCISTAAALGQDSKSPANARTSKTPDIAAAIDQEIHTIEKQVVEAAEAMPEDKFNFTPEGLQLPGSDYKRRANFCLAGQARGRVKLYPVVCAYR